VSSIGDKVYAAVGTAAVVAGAAFAPGPELTATDLSTDKSKDAVAAEQCDVTDEAPSYSDGRPMEGLVEAVSQMVSADVQGQDDDRDLEGVAEAEYSDTAPPSPDSTFAAAEADGEGDAFASEDALDVAEAEAEGAGDAFAADDGDLGDIGEFGDLGAAGDGATGFDGDAGSDSDGGSDGGF
jgi:hypothetical protein